jgi:HSP90 family molecular chaperone
MASTKDEAVEAAEKRRRIEALMVAMQDTVWRCGDATVRTTRKLSETPICLSVGEGDMDMRMERFSDRA